MIQMDQKRWMTRLSFEKNHSWGQEDGLPSLFDLIRGPPVSSSSLVLWFSFLIFRQRLTCS